LLNLTIFTRTVS